MALNGSTEGWTQPRFVLRIFVKMGLMNDVEAAKASAALTPSCKQKEESIKACEKAPLLKGGVAEDSSLRYQFTTHYSLSRGHINARHPNLYGMSGRQRVVQAAQ